MSRPFLRIIKLAADYKWWMALAALMGFFTIGSGIGLMMTSAYIIAKAALHPSISELQVAIVGVRFFGISRGIFRYLERYISHEVTFRLLAKFRVWFYRAIEPLAPARLMHYRSGDLLRRVVADVENLEHVYVRVIAPPLVAMLISLLMWFLFGSYGITFALLLTGFFWLGALGAPLFVRWLSKPVGEEMVAIQTHLNELTVDSLQGMADMLVYNLAPLHFQEFTRLNRRLTRLQQRMSLINGLHEALIGLLMNLTVFFILREAIPHVTAGTLNGIALSVLSIGTMAAFEAVLPMPLAAQFLDSSLKSARRLFDITDARPAVQDPPAPSSSSPADFSIRVENLSFAYSPTEEPVLKDINLHLPEQGKMAIVGASGAGKTTLINLLVRFRGYREGSIRLGGVELRDLPQDQVREYISVVSQQTHLFNGTIRENLLLAQTDADDEALWNVLREAGLAETVRRFPGQLGTRIGEQGLQLSGGERQRLAIARALLKNSPIIIYDEPTANLDALTERNIMHTIISQSALKTTLVITHRLIGLDAMDEIVVLHAGEIVERGREEALIKKEGYYWRFRKQQRQILTMTESVGE